MSPVKIPCPLDDEQCATLTRLTETIPQVQAICDDLTECGADMSRAKTALDAAHKVAAGLLRMKQRMST